MTLVSDGELQVAITRMSAMVVVTVQGKLDGTGSVQLRHILGDLIDGQGNLWVVVDLDGASASDATSLPLFAWAADRSARRGGRLVLRHPPENVHDALLLQGMGHLVAANTVVPSLGPLMLARHHTARAVGGR